jgi:YtfJ family uncharacterized protein
METNMKLIPTIALACMATSFSTWAINLSIGEKAPEVVVKSHGEILIDNGELTYQPWASEQMLGKTRVIQAIAGRSSAKALNKPLMDAISKAEFPQDKYQTTTIVNQDDSIWGTGSFVKSSAEDSKMDFPHSSIVLDEDGAVASSWELDEETSMIAVQDSNGDILWLKQGKLTNSDISQVINLIKRTL